VNARTTTGRLSSGVANLPPASYVSGVSITQMPLPGPDAAAIGIAAFVVVYAKDLWSLAQYLDTMAHEGMHAITGAILGFGVRYIELKPNGDGGTKYRNPPARGGGLVFAGFVGYLGPSAFGLAAAGLIRLGFIIAVLPLAVIFLWLLLLKVLRFRSFGWISVPVAIALLFVLIYFGSVRLQVVMAYGITWLLLLAGVRLAATHWTRARDAYLLRMLTHLPNWVWAVLWVGGTFSALCLGWRLLVAQA
jgi:Peptidase M50B-like